MVRQIQSQQSFPAPPRREPRAPALVQVLLKRCRKEWPLRTNPDLLEGFAQVYAYFSSCDHSFRDCLAQLARHQSSQYRAYQRVLAAAQVDTSKGDGSYERCFASFMELRE